MKTNKNTQWTKMEGVIVEGGPNRSVRSVDGGSYYISNFEKNAHLIPTGTKVSFEGGHPGDHRGVAQKLKKIN